MARTLKAKSMPPRNRVCSIALALTAAVSVSIAGCESLKQQRQPIVEHVSSIANNVADPTGVRRAYDKLGEAASTIKDQVDTIEIERINRVIAEAGDLAAELRTQTAMLSKRVDEVLLGGFERAGGQQTVAKLGDLVDELTVRVAALDVQELNRTTVDTHKLVSTLHAKLDSLDVDGTNQVAADASAVAADLRKTLAGVDELITKLSQTVAGVPTESLNQGIVRIDAAAADLRNVLFYARIALLVGLVVLVLAGYVAVLRIRRPIRG